MNESVASLPRTRSAWWARPALAPLARSVLLARLRGIRDGALTVLDPGRDPGAEAVFGDPSATLRATVTVEEPSFYPAVVFGGSIGAGEAYMDGAWRADDLTAVVRILLRNREQLEGLDRGWARVTAPLRHLFHRLRRNTRRGSRSNVRAHYDVSNDFFRLFLDETMTYSAAIWERGDETLEEAQKAKIDRLCRKLELGPDDHLLEIGTGWGALAVHAASRYGCRVTTTTLSDAQREVAAARVAAAGLEHRVTLLSRDYRELDGRYDKLVSVEMIEAVGLERIPGFFAACSRLLRDDGVMAVQSITIADRFYEAAKRSVDFIQRYIFPGGAIPSVGSLASAIAATDLTPLDLEDIGPFYARTLAAWRERLVDRRNEARDLGFDDRFLRMFDYYFCYCEGGFLERSISDVQMLLAKPGARSAPLLRPLPERP